MEKPTIVIIGSAGSGKGTQAELIKENLGYDLVEAGAIFRDKAQEDSELGRRVKQIYESGAHAPDEMITELIRDDIFSVPADEPLLIDGYPRTLGQADMLKDMLKDTGRDPDNLLVVWVKVSKEEMENRLLKRSRCVLCRTVFMSRDLEKCPHCGGRVEPRAYDKPEAIEKRWNFFQEEVIPVIDKYKQEGKLVEIDGGQEIAAVFEDIKNKLKLDFNQT